DNYARSGDPIFLEYQNWKRFTRLPYRSPNHGERFVNHYVNETGSSYGAYENAGTLPVGTIVIKDSFTVTGHGEVQTGPLFMMEKMSAGFVSAAGTWRFMMLRADGSAVGLTGGANSEAVEFCAQCHAKAGADHDYLYFMPDEARVK
ncbi:MAG: cytochrome P460 family protein, partial [Alphaproteobacteria bacterium]